MMRISARWGAGPIPFSMVMQQLIQTLDIVIIRRIITSVSYDDVLEQVCVRHGTGTSSSSGTRYWLSGVQQAAAGLAGLVGMTLVQDDRRSETRDEENEIRLLQYAICTNTHTISIVQYKCHVCIPCHLCLLCYDHF